MRELGEIAEHHRGIGPGIVLVAKFLQGARQIGAHQCLEQIDDAGAVGEAEHLPHVLGAHRPGRMRDRLIEQRERIAHGAFRGARDQRQRLGVRRDRLLAGDALQMLHQQGGIDPAQVEALAARQHGDRDFADFGRGEHEFGVRRRLLQRLEQRVEGGAGKHVHFVEDVHLVAGGNGRVAHGLVDRAHVLDPVMRGGVHLDNVEVPAFHDRLAMDPENRHVNRRPGDRAVRQLIVQRAREDARRRSLADAAHAGEHPGLRDAAGLERVRDRAHHGVLADEVGERRWPVLARQHAISGWCRRQCQGSWGSWRRSSQTKCSLG